MAVQGTRAIFFSAKLPLFKYNPSPNGVGTPNLKEWATNKQKMKVGGDCLEKGRV